MTSEEFNGLIGLNAIDRNGNVRKYDWYVMRSYEDRPEQTLKAYELYKEGKIELKHIYSVAYTMKKYPTGFKKAMGLNITGKHLPSASFVLERIFTE